MTVDLNKYVFPVIEYDPTENPRGVVTADEWNTIMNLLKESTSYTNKALQEIITDLFTASQLKSKEAGKSGAKLIGLAAVQALGDKTDVESALLYLKEQIKQSQVKPVDESIESNHLQADLDLKGTPTIEGQKILTSQDITDTLNATSTNTQAAGAASVFNLVQTKQDTITIGTTEPTEETPGTVYLQYLV